MSVGPIGAPILPGATLGVMGGGQLGRMFVQAAQSMGYFTVVLDPDASSPAGLVSHHHVTADYQNEPALDELALRCDAITTEFENVPAPALRWLSQRRRVSPPSEAVAIAQDRAREKAHFVTCGVPCAPHAVIETSAQLAAVPDALLPGILKTARLGYDGKGQVRVQTRAELTAAWTGLGGVSCVLEKMLPLKMECSVIVARGANGATVNFPVQRNLHRDGILSVTEVYEGNVPSALCEEAINATEKIADGLQYVGVMCVEFFVLQDDSLVVNEMAPRPHNSGHYTIDACDVSQFDLQLRTLTGLPLVAPRQHSPAIMLNLLGDLWFRSGETAVAPPWPELLALPGARLHLYGKEHPRRGRKMGHLTITSPSVAQARATAHEAARLLGLDAF